MSTPSLSALIESILFVAEDPVAPSELAQALGCSSAEIAAALQSLQQEYATQNRGLRLQEREGRARLVTNPAAAQAIEEYLNLDLTTRLSGPALESLAIIAYRQPVTRTTIESIRGVDCSGVLRKLQQQGLIEESGRLDAVGRPILYVVTEYFLQQFGLTSLDELPPLPTEELDPAQTAELLSPDGTVDSTRATSSE